MTAVHGKNYRGHRRYRVEDIQKLQGLTGFKVSPTYKNMLSLFCPDVVVISIKAGESMKIYGLPVIEDEEVSCIQFEFKDKDYPGLKRRQSNDYGKD